MAIKFRRAQMYLQHKNAAVKGLIFGCTGIGKSWLCAQSPKPVIVLTEKNGITSVAHANPDAIVIECLSADDLFKVILDAQDKKLDLEDENGELHQIEFDTLVIDSLTEAQRLIRDRILERAKREEMILKDWNTLANHMQKMVRAIRDLPCHVICTALQEELYEDSTGVRYVRPQFDGKKTTQQIAQYFNFVGWLYKKDGGISKSSELMPRFLMLDGPSNIMCKPAHPVVGVIEDPSIQKIFDDIQGSGIEIKSRISTTETEEKPKETRRRRRMA